MMDDASDTTLREVAELLRAAAAKLDAVAATSSGDAGQAAPSANSEPPVLSTLRELEQLRMQARESEAELDAAHQHRHAVSGAYESAANRVDEIEAAVVSGEQLDDTRQDPEEVADEARAQLAHVRDEVAHASEVAAGVRERHEVAIATLESVRARLRNSSSDVDQASHSYTVAPIRVLALQTLQELGAPAPSALIGEYIQARFGREIPADRWGALRRDEQKSWESYRRRGKPRTAWLCPALDADSGEAVTRLWTRSDWPLSLRIVLAGDQTLHLRLLYRLALLALAPPADASRVHHLRELASSHLREQGFRLDGPTTEEALGSVVLALHDSLTAGDIEMHVRAHDPNGHRPAAPDWFDDLDLPDSDVELLFGRGADIPF